MARKTIQMFGAGLQGKSPDVTANKLTNAYYEFSPQADRTRVTIYGTPGLTRLANAGAAPWRGLLSMSGNSRAFGVNDSTLYEIDNGGTLTARGTLNTIAGKVCMDTDGTQILIVDGRFGYGYDTSTGTFAQIVDTDFPPNQTPALGGPNTCTYQGGRFVVDINGTGRWAISDRNDVFAWNALLTATAEANPDFLVRVANHRGRLAFFGEITTEFWQNVGGAGLPYARVLDADMEYGLAARWSLARHNGTLAFLAKNREGQVTVMALDGYRPKRISNDEFDSIINSYSTASDAEGYGYMLGGHPMYQLNFPAAGKSWLYDASTDYWSELRSGTTRHRAALGTEFVERTLVADFEDGRLYRLSKDVFTDDGATIVTVMRGRHIFDNDLRFRLDRLQLNGQRGVGDLVNDTTPVAMLRLSKDGGHSFGTEKMAQLGAQGEYDTRTVWRRLGAARDVVAEISVSSPVRRVFTSCVISAQQGMS